MDREELIKLGKYIIDSIAEGEITPSKLFSELAKGLSGNPKETFKLFKGLWIKNKLLENDFQKPYILSPGYSDLTTEEQLSSYLPEEKILINKDIFRNIINDQDLTNIGESRQRELIQELNKESIGLTNNDVLLYYNLLKINQLSQNRIDQNSKIKDDCDYSNEIYQMVVKEFNLTVQNIKRVNGSKTLDESKIITIIRDGIDKNRINPYVLRICLGYKNSKYIKFFVDFINFLTKQRGDDSQEILTYIGLYILINGASEKSISGLELGSNVEAFINDRIGRVKSIYYVAMLFIHTLNIVIIAQINEISTKFFNSDLDQRLKLEKLYSADNRRELLYNNALAIASRKISSYKTESLEVQSAFKRFYGNKNELITVNDIFKSDYRS